MNRRYDGYICAVALGVLAGGMACDRVTSPTPSPAAALSGPPPSPGPQTPFATISGTVWVHGVNGTKTPASGRLSGWIQLDRSGSSLGWVVLDASGRYSVSAPTGALVRVFAGEQGYQPCEMVEPNLRGPVTRDIHVVSDPSLLGAGLPPELAADTPTLSGVVFDSNGRTPLSDVVLELDGLDGLGVPTARTRTDSEGRYVFCGLRGETSTYLYAMRNGSIRFEGTVQLSGATNTTFDIPVR
jgi:hypothetical protein